MITKRGSQSREPLEETEFTLIGAIGKNEVVLQTDFGPPELWAKKDDAAGYVIVINGQGYEFVRTALSGDRWWMSQSCQD
jgi:hypothetical protein